MTDVLMTCPRCEAEIAVPMERAVLRVDVEPAAWAELLYCCPECREPNVRPVVGELLTLLLLVGVPPVALGEPRLGACDLAPPGPAFTPDDLLTWHDQLGLVVTVEPWEATD